MIAFHPISLSDKQWIDDLIRRSDFKGSEYSFANNFNWRSIYHVEAARVNDYYVVKTNLDTPNHSYLYPAGSGDIKAVIEKMIQDAEERNIPFSMHGILAENKEKLEQLFPNKFIYTEERDIADYIYLSERLATLAGKKLHSKRNHINRFIETQDWSYEDMTESNIPECIEMNKKWCAQNDCHLSKSLQQEACSVKSAFENFTALGLEGGLLRSNGEVIAFTIGEPLSSDTYIVHIEKAFSEIQGAYPMINQQFVQHKCADFKYVNREDDTGEEGLRKAKLSYYPDILLEKYSVRLKG